MTEGGRRDPPVPDDLRRRHDRHLARRTPVTGWIGGARPPAGRPGRGPRGGPAAAPPRADWAVTSATATQQLGYELQASSSAAFVHHVSSTGAVEALDQLDVVTPGGPLTSREVRHLRVRVATEHGWSAWSSPTRMEAGLLEPADWSAVAVTLPDDPGARRQGPAPLLRRTFGLPAAPVPARLHVTSLGDHELRINGVRVGDHLLDPGWTS